MLYGFDVGGTKIAFAVYQNNKQVFHQQVPTPTNSYREFLNTLEQLVLTADKQFGKTESVGLGIPGMIHPETKLAHCVNIACLNNKPLLTDLETRLKRSIYIENDANCFVLSEVYGGAANKHKTVFGIILGTGCGSGLFLNGKLHKGKRHLAGEWGHTPIPRHIMQLANTDFPVLPCDCGLTDCLENYLSGGGLSTIYQYYSHKYISCEAIIDDFTKNKPEAQKSIALYCELLACTLGAIVNLLDPNMIVVGGGLSNFSNLYDYIPQQLNKYTMHSNPLPPFLPAHFGSDSGVRGAALLNSVDYIS